MGELLARGKSWSGRERNCCFLNLRDNSFAGVGALLDVDAMDDSRAGAATDWDLDGDLDLWMTNRTNPRIRILQNPFGATTTSITFKLIGINCNRDAIGAKIEIDWPGKASSIKSIREVKAGDGYLSQSSKWVHFGLGTADADVDVKVVWPDGTTDTFASLASGARYVLTQGGSAELHATHIEQSNQLRNVQSIQKSNSESRIRLIPQTPLPLPSSPTARVDGTIVDISRPANPTLVVFWANWCQPCLSELKALSAARQEFQRTGVDLLAVNVDHQDQSQDEKRTLARADAERLGVTIPNLVASPELVENVDVVLRTLVTTREPMTLPTSILIDADGRLVAVYKGAVSVRQVLSDVEQLAVHKSHVSGDPRDLAIPFAGRWFTNPPPVDLLAVPGKFVQIDRTRAAFDYLERHVRPLWVGDAKNDTETKARELLKEQVSQVYYDVAIGFAEGKGTARDLQATENALKFAIAVSPDHWDSLGTLGSLYSQSGRDQLAVSVFQRMLQIRSSELSVANNLAWILATTPDDELLDPVTALALAKKVCERSDYSIASTLDTLSVAYAANGQFDSAIEIAEKALVIVVSEQKTESGSRLQERIELYRNRKPFRR